MRRRDFIAGLGGAAVVGPRGAWAQQPVMPVIGFLANTSRDGGENLLAAARRGLDEAGYAEGQQILIESRWADDKDDRLQVLAADLVRSRVSVIIATFMRPALAAKAATSTIPILFATGNDPVKFGLVASLNKPGGNVTGVTYLTSLLGEKRLELLHALVPIATAVGVLVNPSDVNAEANLRNAQAAASAIGLQTRVVNARTEAELDDAFAVLARQRASVLLVLNDPLFRNQRAKIVSLSARQALPAIYTDRDFAEIGGLMSYGANVAEAFRLVGGYAGRILKGEKPAELPVLQPTKFEFVINLKTAKALGLAVPDKVLALADEVIE
jgi:putative tryptophan/tyrosine transport system substrate-binding protein